jgi:hypothetical protein
MIQLDETTRKALIELFKTKNIGLEGNITKLIDSSGDDNFKKYLEDCFTRDKEVRKKRLDITKQIQTQNKELSELNSDNERMMFELQETLKNVEDSKKHIELQNRELIAWKEDNERISLQLVEQMKQAELAKEQAENAKKNAENDLDILQKKTQFELINTIVKAALYVIVGVGITTTVLYMVAIFMNKETQVIGSTWSNMFGILLTNAFSIVGTIMGVKYASDKKQE